MQGLFFTAPTYPCPRPCRWRSEAGAALPAPLGGSPWACAASACSCPQRTRPAGRGSSAALLRRPRARRCRWARPGWSGSSWLSMARFWCTGVPVLLYQCWWAGQCWFNTCMRCKGERECRGAAMHVRHVVRTMCAKAAAGRGPPWGPALLSLSVGLAACSPHLHRHPHACHPRLHLANPPLCFTSKSLRICPPLRCLQALPAGVGLPPGAVAAPAAPAGREVGAAHLRLPPVPAPVPSSPVLHRLSFCDQPVTAARQARRVACGAWRAGRLGPRGWALGRRISAVAAGRPGAAGQGARCLDRVGELRGV